MLLTLLVETTASPRGMDLQREAHCGITSPLSGARANDAKRWCRGRHVAVQTGQPRCLSRRRVKTTSHKRKGPGRARGLFLDFDHMPAEPAEDQCSLLA